LDAEFNSAQRKEVFARILRELVKLGEFDDAQARAAIDMFQRLNPMDCQPETTFHPSTRQISRLC
jgi:hypothetical protein